MGKKFNSKYWASKRGARTVFKKAYYVRIFQLSRAGLGDMDIAKALGVTYPTFKKWRIKDKGIRYALAEGRKDTESGVKAFFNYIHKRLPAHLHEVWDVIMACDEMETPNAIARMEAMLQSCGRRGKQHLFLHALVHCNFNPSDACRLINIKRKTLDRWIMTDPEFSELIDEIDWHKKNFFEGELVKLVREGDPQIVKFVNETYNADRGYAKKSTIRKDVNISGTVTNVNTQLAMDDLLKDLPLKVRKQILENMRNLKNGQPPVQEAQ